MTHPSEALFWDCAAEMYNQPGVIESTMFGFRCIRVDEQFVAMPADDAMFVKLPATRVTELLGSGRGEECAPAGRRFKEWVKIRELDEAWWLELLAESIDFVRPNR